MITLDESISVGDLVSIVRLSEPIELDAKAREKIAETRAVIEDIADANDRPVYGINTGFGDLYDTHIAPEDQKQLQENLLWANTTVGDPLSIEEVRAAMVARGAVLAAGHSGISPEAVETLIECLNEGVHPVIGRNGNADDYAVSAGIGYMLMGEGEAFYDGHRMRASEALSAAGIEPLSMGPMDGLPFMDGPSLMTGRLSMAVHDTWLLLDAADIAGSLTFAFIGQQPSAFSKRVSAVRPHEGDATSARLVREILELETRTEATVAQDPLSIRTIPQTHGSAREALSQANKVADTELGSVGDNPLVFPDGTIYSCGGFNGQHISSTADTLQQALVKVGHGSERRVHFYIDGRGHSPPYVTKNPGVESGLGRAHYTAASLVEEASSLGSVTDRNIVVSAGQEDLHSMGTIATEHLATSVEKIRSVIAVELLAAVEAYRITQPNIPGPASEILESLDERIQSSERSGQIADIAATIESGRLTELVDRAGIDLPSADRL